MTDAKTIDAQAGYEKGITVTAAALAGANLVSAYPGIVGSLMGQSFEGLVIDNDLLGSVQRLVRGIEVTDETLSFDVIADAVAGIGHYLGSEQTVRADALASSLYPELADRTSPGRLGGGGKPERSTSGRTSACARSSRRTTPPTSSPPLDARIRERFPIRLDPADMRPGNGRW